MPESAKQLSSLSIFFPCYNDAGTVGSLVLLAFRAAGWLTDDYEVIVVDDCSTDNSRAILEELAGHYPRLRLVCHDTNRGYGGALRSGFAAARKEFIFYTDGDGQYDVLELPRLAERMREGVDVVNGYKVNRADPWFRRLVGFGYNLVSRRAFGLKVRDVDCDYRLLRRSVLDQVKLESDTGVICVEMMKKIADAGLRVEEVPVHHFPRLYGRSQFFTVPHVARSVIALARFWRQTRKHAR
jgi:glycosyltransferase involved in cell wall biosynthesis